MLFHGRYRLVEMKGRGSFGEVWLAHDEQLSDLEVAIKVYIALDDHGIDEFKREYTTTFGLSHPNLLHAHHFDQCDNRPYLVMPYCPTSAMTLIGNTDETTLWHFLHDVADGLAYLHGKDILHHDIKPDNVLCDTEGNFLITDFGISTKMRSTLRRNSTHQTNAATAVGGSIPYMAPEMFNANAQAVKASDVWALGATLFEMATGELPFFGQGGVMQKNGAEVPEVHGPFSDLFKQTVSQCMAKETWERPTARQLEERAKAMLEGRQPEAFVVERPQQAPLPVNRSTQKMTPQSASPVMTDPKPKMPAETAIAKPKSKVGLWIGVAVAIVAIVVAVALLAKPKAPDADTLAFQDCRTVEGYRGYLSNFGRNAHHYDDAKAVIDQHVADSIAKAQQLLAEQQARQKAEEEAQVQAEAAKKEEDAYKKCTTLASCDKYLKDYPQGRYVAEVEAKKAELKAKGVSGSANGHEYVDLGLPSGTLWATCNIGASRSEDYGNYYAWGETKTKSTYNWDTYKYANGDYNKMTKYCCSSDRGNNGFTDNLTTLQAGDDPAANWGSGWHMPSDAQFGELKANTTQQWTTRGGKKGMLFTSKKNGRFVFLPAAGYRESSLKNVGSSGHYWSMSVNRVYPNVAIYFYLASGDCGLSYSSLNRCSGLTIRPVRQK